jgi:hypothetical protein
MAKFDNARRVDVFVSYSRKDLRWLQRLKVHLTPLTREYDFVWWDDTRLRPGSKWRQEIQKAVDKANAAILIVSADFLASEFIHTNELPPLLKVAEEEGVLFISAAAFGALSLWGYTTGRDLTPFGSFLIMGLFGIIIASLVNIFLGSSQLQWIISVIAVIVFAGHRRRPQGRDGRARPLSRLHQPVPLSAAPVRRSARLGGRRRSLSNQAEPRKADVLTYFSYEPCTRVALTAWDTQKIKEMYSPMDDGVGRRAKGDGAQIACLVR